MTVTLAAPKLPLVLPPGEAHAGDVVIADIGIPPDVLESLDGPHIELLTPEQVRSLVEPRAPSRTRATSAASRSWPGRAARPARRTWRPWVPCGRAQAS